jgi:oxygen-independent coproporphyrinogen-3 oxidase
MPHLYLHIPFCKQACYYCDFHFSTSLQRRSDMVDALITELTLRHTELPSRPLETIYFGGGTPSLLKSDELLRLFEAIYRHFDIQPDAEITLEGNPDDLTSTYLRELRQTPVNRLSIGIQSFRDVHLKLMNRSHTAQEAEASVKRSQDNGITNLTIDLIYGIPNLSQTDWQENLSRAFALQTQHFSAYNLTVEPNTVLAHQIKKGILSELDDEQCAQQFIQLQQFAAAAGFQQYEISNFALPDFEARHNCSYWNNTPYLGLGPSAHSYDGELRRKNIANNSVYINQLATKKTVFEIEVLTPAERYNEFVLTRLRTSRGIAEQDLNNQHSDFATFLRSEVASWINTGEVEYTHKTYRLTDSGKLLADRIAASLFVV